MKCSIVVATYNRPELFKRILHCIEIGDYDSYNDIDLILSIDHANNFELMRNIADSFEWKHGKKTVLQHESRLGLRGHFLYCGNLTQEYGPIIFLEDDVFVSTCYYKIAIQLASQYVSDSRIAGASLYSIRYNETAQRPFLPLEDGSDVFFAGLMSWAPVYFPEQWKGFYDWFLTISNNNLDFSILPKNVFNWGKTSFKKLHIYYMMLKKIYFVYPRQSCATNFGEPGEHYSKNTNVLQVSLLQDEKHLTLRSFDQSNCIYDSFLEIEPIAIKRICPQISKYDFTTDFYGLKCRNQILSDYILTCRKSFHPIMKYGRKMIPHEANVIYDITDIDGFCLSKTNDVSFKKKSIKMYTKDVLYDVKGSTVLKIFINDIIWLRNFTKNRLK